MVPPDEGNMETLPSLPIIEHINTDIVNSVNDVEYLNNNVEIGIPDISEVTNITRTDSRNGHMVASTVPVNDTAIDLTRIAVHNQNEIDLLQNVINDESLINDESFTLLGNDLVHHIPVSIRPCNNDIDTVHDNIHDNILIIGISHSKGILSQWQEPNVVQREVLTQLVHRGILSNVQRIYFPDITLFRDTNGNPFGESVMRDFLRCLMVETLYQNARIHTVNVCEDGERNSRYLHNCELNVNCNHRHFIESMERRQWRINELYVDYYRMPNVYLSSTFHNVFFQNLKK
jgi:hypothetical protein